MAMKFNISRHAAGRLKKRGMPNPNGLILKKCSRRLKKMIKKSCLGSGFDSENYIYLSHNSNCIYVAVFQEIGVFKLITSFKYETEKQES